MVNAGDGVRATVRAGDGNRTRMTSLEGWDSAIELRPQSGSEVIRAIAGAVPWRLGGAATIPTFGR
jgi:hypothetical protein